MSDFAIKLQDRLPVLQSTLSDANGAIDLSLANSVSLVYKNRYSGVPVTGSASIINPTSGIVQYAWSTGDVYSKGLYRAEWRIEFINGKQETFPNDGAIYFEIVDRIF